MWLVWRWRGYRRLRHPQEVVLLSFRSLGSVWAAGGGVVGSGSSRLGSKFNITKSNRSPQPSIPAEVPTILRGRCPDPLSTPPDTNSIKPPCRRTLPSFCQDLSCVLRLENMLVRAADAARRLRIPPSPISPKLAARRQHESWE